jgi:alpha-methylacyl-CoA racemase
MEQGAGPLRGVKVVELAGIGPVPHAAMTLADLGADVIRIERPGGSDLLGPRETDLLTRGRPSVELDLKDPAAVAVVLDLVERADVLVEGMRPGVAERLGIGPAECHSRNPRLVYGRMTGWGQEGPLAGRAGHDINYIAVSGVLHGLGREGGPPQFPQNLLGDFGGGSTYLVIGVLAALVESRISGKGQVVDAAIVDGAAHLGTMLAGMLASGAQSEQRGQGLLDSGAPFYDVFETSDHEHMAVGALEPEFYAALLDGLGLTSDDVPDRYDPTQWPALRVVLAERFSQRTQQAWTEAFESTDACVTPVLPMTRAAAHPHLTARGTYVEHHDVVQPAPAPRFSRTAPTLTTPPSEPVDVHDVLRSWGTGRS